MPIGFTISADLKSVELALVRVKNGVPRAATRAINRTLTTVRAAAAREIATDIGVPATAVKKALAVTKARFRHLEGLITITGRRIPLSALRPTGPEPSRGKGQGVSYALGGSRRRIREAFLATLKSGHRGVFRRVPPSLRKSRGAWSKNLPIIELFGPSIPRVAGKTTIRSLLRTLGMATYVRNLKHEVQFLLRTRDLPTGDE